MRSFLRITLLVAVAYIFPFISNGQGAINALQQKLLKLKSRPGYLNDSTYIKALNELAFLYADINPDTAIVILNGQAERCKSAGFGELESDTYKILGNAYETKGKYENALEHYQKAYKLADEIDYKKALPGILNNIGLVYYDQGNYPAALEKFYETLQSAEALNNKFVAGSTLNNIANIHFFQGKMKEAEADYQKMLAIATETRDTASMILAHSNIAEVNLKQHNSLAALSHLTTAGNLANSIHDPGMLAETIKTRGYVYLQSDSLSAAISQFKMAVKLSEKLGNVTLTCDALKGLAAAQQRMGLLADALTNGLKAVQLAQQIGHAQLIKDGSEITASVYEASGDAVNALKYYRMFKTYSDSINNVAGERAAATFKADYEISKKELEFQKKSLQQKWLIFSACAALLTLIVVIWLVNKNRSKLAHTYKDLQHKNLLIEAQKVKAEETLNRLKAAQAQLIQSEKMASLGELTAGIAHEIQNPLNFVNNFSEVSSELIDEMNGELDKGDINEARSIAADLKKNLEKINHHGKRAGDIVKSMLQHSQISSGKKEFADINKLAEEYLRLAYNGLRTKDKSFNATLDTEFDKSIGSINIIPQDIGRVLLNLYNNAFYATNEKSKQTIEYYEPIVSVSTKKVDDKILISVKDNGNGIPQKIVDKIFQPFFTTKPTGQGTGLGLSLSYDIVKAHGGELKVITKELDGSVFVILLPLP